MIRFFPNDPVAAQRAPMREQPPRPERPLDRAGLRVFGRAPAAGLHEPGSPAFLFWQCREALLAALDAWELSGGPLPSWQGGDRLDVRLNLPADAFVLGEETRVAEYRRDGLRFYRVEVGERRWSFASSVDVVSHEVGHAVLDALCPSLWEGNDLEIAAFHEAFGDCLSLLTGLADPAVCQAALDEAPDLSTPHFLETLGEMVAAAGVDAGLTGAAATARRALHTLRWAPPSSLPLDGGPDLLTQRPGSFGRVFTGCFYDLVRKLFAAAPQQDAASLGAAGREAGALLAAASSRAVYQSSCFSSVAAAMLSVDTERGGTASSALRAAFADHGVPLAAPPSPVLESPFVPILRAVDLGPLDRRLRGVVAMSFAPPLRRGGLEAVEVEPPDEALAFADMLLRSGHLALTQRDRRAVVTHGIDRKKGRRPVLRRLRFH